MTYDIIITDVFNLFYRKKGSLKQKPYEQAASCIKYINEEIQRYLRKDGKLYLLYDPMPKTDLGINKKFSYTTYRQEIDPGYKANRHHDINVQEACRLIYNYYNYRGPNILNVSEISLEADDFVEQIVAKYPDKKIALFTSDMDWARYLSNNIVIIDKTFETPFTKGDFKKKYNYNPTILSVILKKALFGDESDNITGALKVKKVKFLDIDIEKIANKVIEEESKKSESIDDFIYRFKNYHIGEIINKIEKTNEEQLYLDLDGAISTKENVFLTFLDNIRLIRCRCKNVDKYISYHDENDEMNDLIEQTLGFKKSTKKFKFGCVKISK